MTDRLLMGLSGGAAQFKLSAPGFDVDVASEFNMLFNVAEAGYAGVLLAGTVLQSAFTAFSGAGSNYYGFSAGLKYEIPFSKTFAKPPRIVLSMPDPLAGGSFRTPRYEPNSVYFDGSFHGCQVQVRAQIETAKLVLLMSRLYYDGTLYAYPANVSYVVFQS